MKGLPFWSTVVAIALGIILGLLAYTVWEDDLFQSEPPPPSYPPFAQTITPTGQIPYWMGMYNQALWDRYPVYYCLDGPGWTQDDHDAAQDGLTAAWGWAKVNRTILTQIQERCDELPRVTVRFIMDPAFVQTYCQPGAPFVVVACVTFDGWTYIPEVNAFKYATAVVHVESRWWATENHAWRELILIHEFGHAAFALNDTPAQAAGVTAMDYTYEVLYGIPPYPTGADITVANALYGPYKDPAWYKWESR